MYCMQIDQSNKSHNAPVPHPTMHPFDISVLNSALWDMDMWDLLDCVYFQLIINPLRDISRET